MKRLFALSMLFVFFGCRCFTKNVEKPNDFVDPFICIQDDHGQWHPAVLAPFGIVKLGPDSYPSSLTGDGDFAHDD